MTYSPQNYLSGHNIAVDLRSVFKLNSYHLCSLKSRKLCPTTVVVIPLSHDFKVLVQISYNIGNVSLLNSLKSQFGLKQSNRSTREDVYLQ